MPWKSNDPDPLGDRRRKLAEQERLLAEQRRRLTDALQGTGDVSTASLKPAEPPVWRMEDDAMSKRSIEPTAARKRNLARQRQRDMLLFFLCIGVFLLVLVVVLWVAYVHNTTTSNGA